MKKLFITVVNDIFQVFFPTKVTKFGKSLFYITNENDYIARLTRLGRMHDVIVYRQAIERVK